MSEMQRLTLSDTGELYDGPHATPKRHDDGPYFLNISSLKSGRLDLAASDHVSEEDYIKWTRRVTPQGGDLLFSYETRIGEAALMPDGVRACLGRRMALLRPDRSVVVPRFLIYYYLSPEFQKVIESHTIHGATVNRIGLATMPKWEISIPDLSEQQAIAEVLGALDDKIAANDRTLSLLDDWVRASYQALNGSSVSISALASNVRSQVRPESIDPEISYLGLEHLPRRRMWASESGQASEITSSKFEFAESDVLFGKLRPYFHKVVVAGGSGVCSTDILVVRANDPDLRGLVLAACSDESTIHKCTSLSEGTKMPRTNWSQLRSVSVTWPGEAPAREFSWQAIEKANLAHGLVRESEKLSNARDALLPLLMSGKVHVRDAEKIVEGVV